EVAEPFQILVVANFPTNFSEAASRKLVSIATSGPRCGIYTLIMVDRKVKMPANFNLSDLQMGAVHLDWQSAKEKTDLPEGFDDLDADWAPTSTSTNGGLTPIDVAGGSPAGRSQLHEAPRFRWLYQAFQKLPLTLHKPPAAEQFNDVVR